MQYRQDPKFRKWLCHMHHGGVTIECPEGKSGDNVLMAVCGCGEILVKCQKDDDSIGFEKLNNHQEHEVEIGAYEIDGEPVKVALECIDCYEVIEEHDEFIEYEEEDVC